MKFEVRCECGKSFAISPTDAGAVFDCSCGKPVKIPPLHLLRTNTGESTKSPLTEIRALLPTGLLPGIRTCAVCGAGDSRHSRVPHLRVKIVCERVPNTGSPSKAEVVGCLFAPLLIGQLAALLLVLGLRSNRVNVGDEEAVIVPLPVCSNCRPQCDQEEIVRKALLKIPDYANLLEHYPKAEVQVV